MVEEGVASAEDIDKAIKYGFGVRFATLGMLEFIDWGGGDILYHASRYLTRALGDGRYAAPEIVERNMAEGRIGLKTGKGFLDYASLDVAADTHAGGDAFAPVDLFLHADVRDLRRTVKNLGQHRIGGVNEWLD